MSYQSSFKNMLLWGNKLLILIATLCLFFNFSNVIVSQDFDGDGVSDTADVDDDNDGILDDDECPASALQNNVGDGWSIVNRTLTSYNYDVFVGDVLLRTNYFTNPETLQVYDLRAEVMSTYSTAGTLAGTPQFASGFYNMRDGNPSQQEYFEIRLSFVEAGTVTSGNLLGTPVTFSEVVVSLQDLDNTVGSADGFTDIGGFDSAATITTVGSKLSSYTLTNGEVVYGLANFADNDNGGDLPDGSKDPDYAVTATYSSTTYMTFKHGVYGTNTVSGTNRGGVFQMEITICPDTDQDGDIDAQDLDSDNDGCSDADEAYDSEGIDGDDGMQYGTGDPLTLGEGEVNADGSVIGANYTSYDANTITASNTAVEITEDTAPSSITVCANETASFTPLYSATESVTFSGGTVATSIDVTGELNFAWYLSTNGGVSFAGTPFATTESLSLSSGDTEFVNNYVFKLEVSHVNNICVYESPQVTLSINSTDTDLDGVPDA